MTIDVMMRDIRVIPLDKIKLDKENVRFGNDVAESQLEAIRLLMSDPDDARKILRLAEHMVQHGFDPTELQLVMPDDEGNFVVLEGNRRLTALKLLQRPDLCTSERSYKGFLKAQKNLPNGVPQNLQCSVVPDRAAGDIWIELKHTGENKGAGRVDWDSNIRDERRARTTGVESIGRQLRNMIKDNPKYFTAKAALDCMEVDVTTLTRLFSSSTGQSIFRLKVENKTLNPQLSLEHIAPAVEFMLDMFISQGYNVNDVRAEPDRVRTLNHIPPEILAHNLAEAAKLKHKSASPTQNSPVDNTAGANDGTQATIPDSNSTSTSTTTPSPGSNQAPVAPLQPTDTSSPNATGSPTDVGAAPDNNNVGAPDNAGTNLSTEGPANQNPVSQEPATQTPAKPSGTANTNPEPPKEPGIRAKPQSRARKYLIPWSLSISNSRINAIYRELRNILIVDECPKATAVTFRVFMETTCDDYIQTQKDAGTPIKRWDTGQDLKSGQGDKLSAKLHSVVKHLEAQKLLPPGVAKAIVKRATSSDSAGSIDHFNLFVHGTQSLPLPSELKDIAEEYRPLMEAIWR
ncbi:hypothetical protein [Pseudomonas asiatica]|uniref:hypothetical protein n=1 Tax=Pseudomonas asiatica TaxID=2219225 RepID=UPI003877A330